MRDARSLNHPLSGRAVGVPLRVLRSEYYLDKYRCPAKLEEVTRGRGPRGCRRIQAHDEDFTRRLIDDGHLRLSRVWYVLPANPNPTREILVIPGFAEDGDRRHSWTRHPVAILGSSREVRDHCAIGFRIQQIPVRRARNGNPGSRNQTILIRSYSRLRLRRQRRAGNECEAAKAEDVTHDGTILAVRIQALESFRVRRGNGARRAL